MHVHNPSVRTYTIFVPDLSRMNITTEQGVRSAFTSVFDNDTLVNDLIYNSVHGEYDTYKLPMAYKVAQQSQPMQNQQPPKYTFEIRDPTSNSIISSLSDTYYVAKGSYGEVYIDPAKKIAIKIVRSGKINKSRFFLSTLYETAIQVILSNIYYVPSNGKKVRCAPIIHSFFNYDLQIPGEIGFLLVMELMKDNADSHLDDIANIFYNTTSILKSIQDTDIYYNHCDMKLNNMMYDTNGRLRLIDFGFSSMYFATTDTKRPIQFISGECKWMDSRIHTPMTTPSIPGYYPQKDIIQLALSTYNIYYKHMKQPAKDFMNALLNYYGLGASNKIYLDSTYDVPSANFFKKAYNYDTSLRLYLQAQRPNVLDRTRLNKIIEDYQTYPSYPPPSAQPSKEYLIRLVYEAIETDNMEMFQICYNLLPDKNNIILPNKVHYISHIIENGRYEMLEYALQHRFNPNTIVEQTMQITPLIYVLSYTDDAEVRRKMLKLLVQYGADINKPVTYHKMMPLYLIMTYTNPKERMDVFRDFIQYKPRPDIPDIDGKKLTDYVRETQDAAIQALAMEYIRSLRTLARQAQTPQTPSQPQKRIRSPPPVLRITKSTQQQALPFNPNALTVPYTFSNSNSNSNSESLPPPSGKTKIGTQKGGTRTRKSKRR